MKTDDLIRALAQDVARPRASMPLQLAVAIGLGGLVALLMFLQTLGFRPDLADAAGTWRFLFKFLVPVIACASAFWACLQLARPERRVRDVLPALLIGPGLALAGVAMEVALTPASLWAARALGRYSGTCLIAIPSLSAVSLVAAMAVLRRGAPRSPALAGAVAGLLAGTASAAIYATPPRRFPLFFALWYVTAVGFVVLAGAVAGNRMLRW